MAGGAGKLSDVLAKNAKIAKKTPFYPLFSWLFLSFHLPFF
jgi:hypothetical protein